MKRQFLIFLVFIVSCQKDYYLKDLINAESQISSLNSIIQDLETSQNEILERILTLEPNLILAEQFNPNTNEMLSANKLTWNYSELYKLYKLLN